MRWDPRLYSLLLQKCLLIHRKEMMRHRLHVLSLWIALYTFDMPSGIPAEKMFFSEKFLPDQTKSKNTNDRVASRRIALDMSRLSALRCPPGTECSCFALLLRTVPLCAIMSPRPTYRYPRRSRDLAAGGQVRQVQGAGGKSDLTRRASKNRPSLLRRGPFFMSVPGRTETEAEAGLDQSRSRNNAFSASCRW